MLACDAIVIGGGAAGIGAARELRKAGLGHVVILEARQRLGGRVHSSDELGCGVPLDKGAQWIHGYSPTHPMVTLAEELDKAHRPMAGGFSTTVLSDGRGVSNLLHMKAGEQFSELQQRVAQSKDALQPNEDCSWIESSERIGGVERLSPEEQAVFNLRIYNSCENYEGARLDHWSAKSWNMVTCLAGGNGDIDGGFGDFIVEAAHDLHVQFNRRVESIAYMSHADPHQDVPRVVVRCKNTGIDGDVEETYYAPCCVVTLPLGVLRAGNVKFEPELPPCKRNAMNTLGISVMNKIELLWHERWWPKGVDSFQIASLESTSTYHPWPWFYEPPAMRGHPLGWAGLVCYATGQFAEYVESLSEDEAARQCWKALRSAFPSEAVPEPAEVYVTRWASDEFAHGSWTYFAVGSGLHDVQALREPIGLNGCVAFAGEHTCDGSVLGLDMGTVHGAWLSGEIATKGLVQRLGQRAGELALEKLGMWRCSHRHCTDSVIPEIEGYDVGVTVQVTNTPSEIAEEFSVDPDEEPSISRAQLYCGKRGVITHRSCWGWLRVEFDDCSPSRWWTPYCLWILHC